MGNHFAKLYLAADELEVLDNLVEKALRALVVEPAVSEWSMLNSLRTALREALWGLRHRETDDVARRAAAWRETSTDAVLMDALLQIAWLGPAAVRIELLVLGTLGAHPVLRIGDHDYDLTATADREKLIKYGRLLRDVDPNAPRPPLP